VPTKPELDKLKSKMTVTTDALRNERLNNMDMNPVDNDAINLDIVKEQVLDLNDKFDFLISLLVKSKQMGVANVGKETDFVIGQPNSSLNGESFDINNDEEVLAAVKTF
jgi:hypothetical protein